MVSFRATEQSKGAEKSARLGALPIAWAVAEAAAPPDFSLALEMTNDGSKLITWLAVVLRA